MIVRLLEIAEIELDEAVRWYGAQVPGLGEAFCRLSRFPYGLVYTIDNGDILVLAVTLIQPTTHNCTRHPRLRGRGLGQAGDDARRAAITSRRL